MIEGNGHFRTFLRELAGMCGKIPSFSRLYFLLCDVRCCFMITANVSPCATDWIFCSAMWIIAEVGVANEQLN
jgi:hypothetical protein